MVRVQACELSDDGAVVHVDFDDGARSSFHAIWLRDNAQDDATRDRLVEINGA